MSLGVRAFARTPLARLEWLIECAGDTQMLDDNFDCRLIPEACDLPRFSCTRLTRAKHHIQSTAQIRDLGAVVLNTRGLFCCGYVIDQSNPIRYQYPH